MRIPREVVGCLRQASESQYPRERILAGEGRQIEEKAKKMDERQDVKKRIKEGRIC